MKQGKIYWTKYNVGLKHEGEFALECKNVIQDVICRIKAMKGVEDTYVLSEEDKEKILEQFFKNSKVENMNFNFGKKDGDKIEVYGY